MSAAKRPYGRPVKLLVDLEGFEDGRLVQFEVWRRKGEKEEKVTEVYGVVKSENGVGEWIPQFKERKEVLPLKKEITETVEEERYYFVAKIDDKESKSDDLTFTYPLEIHLEDEEQEPVDDVEFTITFSDGSKKKGVFRNGHATFDGAPAGKFELELEDYRFVFEK